ncbi:MAG: glycosyltransferase [Lachnospiraceae bacterium]|nr:glycosyltransferase [Lachnospiraceae bacterium]
MEDTLKHLIQKKLHEQQERKYEEELKLQKDSYAAFLRIYEAGLAGNMDEILPKTSAGTTGGGQTDGKTWMKFYGHTVILCQDHLSINFFTDQMYNCVLEEDYLLFTAKGGRLSTGHLPKLEEYFQKHPKIPVVYFHTDEIDHQGKRSNPCFLPEWSPDTLASFFYFGECFAVRTGMLQRVIQDLHEMFPAVEQVENTESGKGVREILYAAVLLLTAQEPATLMDVVMYHKEVDAGKHLRKAEREDGLLLDRILKKSMDPARLGRWLAYVERTKVCREQHRISILIPSKDHPDILRRCVESIRKQDHQGIIEDGVQDTKSGKGIEDPLTYEIIVIDNGSGPENRRLYDAYAEELGYRYEYQPMEFNFSKMCNLAAGLASGDYYLFLNDDMEILSCDWLAKMLEFAALSHVGAVGAKLLYPDTTLIQHAGITNMYEGPVHKLLKYNDRVEYYYGRNRGVWDVIGVTAACLMVSKEKFLQVGGFAEELKVAYNDVDLCFRLHQMGMFNVVRNDLILYHHESLSRGNDHLDPAKKERLAAERKVLYRRSPGYYDYDPFYSRHLTGASEAYECTLPYENRNIASVSGLKKLSGKSAEEYPGTAMNETLIIQVDTADKELLARQGEMPCYLIDLHAHVRGLDSCDYRYRMVLKGGQGCYEIPAIRRLRPDVSKTIENEKHVELSGFVARIPQKMLPSDTYEIWMEAKCSYSRQRLCNRAEQTLVVTD